MGAALPLVLAAGCAHENSSSVTFSPLQAGTPTPTSQSTADRVYSEPNSAIGQYGPPPGAPANDWSLAEQVRALLTSDKKLAREPMAAVVDKGVVTLRGYAPNQREKERIEQAVASVPGVTRVDDQLQVHNILGAIKGKSKEY
jgi:hypothetical protein